MDDGPAKLCFKFRACRWPRPRPLPTTRPSSYSHRHSFRPGARRFPFTRGGLHPALRGTPEDKLLDAASYCDGSHWVPAPGPGIGVARPSGRPGQPDPKFDSSRWLLRPGPGRATIPHEPGRRHGDQRTFKRNIEYKTDDGTECQLVHTLAHAIVYIVSVDELTFATKTDDDTECQLVHTLAHGIFCGYVSAAFSVAVEE